MKYRSGSVCHHAGEVADEGDEAVDVRDARAHGDERVHVARAAAQSAPRAAVERPADVSDRQRAVISDSQCIHMCCPGVRRVRRRPLQHPVRHLQREPQDRADDPPSEPGPGRLLLFAEPLLLGTGPRGAGDSGVDG